jgi:hypothetical protein
MITTEDIRKNGLVYDLETIRGCFLGSFYSFETGTYTDFLINKYQNDLYKLVKFLDDNRYSKYFIGFNSLNFDNQVIEWIYDNYQEWYNLTGHELAAKIAAYASKVIDDNNYGLWLPYKEENMKFRPVDIPRIFHWFNENKRVSLKQAEYELRAETIENFEIDPNKEDFTPEDVEYLIYYCHNDVKYTTELFDYVTGNVQHPLYKGKDKIYDRLVVMDEVGLPCLNWDDVKIGSEWNKLDYMKATRKSEDDLKPKKVEQIYGKKFKLFFPPTMKFQTKEMKEFIEKLGNTYILADKQEFKYVFSPTLTVTIAKGGLHSNEGPRFLQPAEDEIYLQCDKGSQYPNAIYKFGIYPPHLGIEWNNSIPVKIERRLGNKAKYKKTKDPRYNSLQEMGKLQLNGGLYGQLGLKGGWQEDQIGLLKTCMGCEIEILMVVEGLTMKGFNVTSVNTDGFDIILKKDRLDEFFTMMEEFETLTGDRERGNFEYTVFEWMVQTSVNDYCASKLGVYEKRTFYEDKIQTKGSLYPHLKMKGDFTIDFDLHKNSSNRIIPLALVAYFDQNIDPEEFINKHNDIFDFCARSSSGSTYYHEGYGKSDVFKLPKLIRYYVAKQGIHIKKIVKPDITTGANDQSVQPSEFLKKVCNRLVPEEFQDHLKNVNRQWYIDKVKETIINIERGKKIKRKLPPKEQLSLF